MLPRVDLPSHNLWHRAGGAPRQEAHDGPELRGTAVDEAHGLFFTNLEDKDLTLAIDARSHEVMKRWQPACGEDGPKGLAFAGHLIVVCPERIETLDDSGATISKLAVGDGLDLIDYIPARHQIVAAAGTAAVLVVATLAADGTLTATIPTLPGARNAVAAETARSSSRTPRRRDPGLSAYKMIWTSAFTPAPANEIPMCDVGSMNVA